MRPESDLSGSCQPAGQQTQPGQDQRRSRRTRQPAHHQRLWKLEIVELDTGILVEPSSCVDTTQGEYDRVVYRRRNEIERLFCRLKGYRRVFSRFDKLDVLFAGFIVLALILQFTR